MEEARETPLLTYLLPALHELTYSLAFTTVRLWKHSSFLKKGFSEQHPDVVSHDSLDSRSPLRRTLMLHVITRASNQLTRASSVR